MYFNLWIYHHIVILLTNIVILARTQPKTIACQLWHKLNLLVPTSESESCLNRTEFTMNLSVHRTFSSTFKSENYSIFQLYKILQFKYLTCYTKFNTNCIFPFCIKHIHITDTTFRKTKYIPSIFNIINTSHIFNQYCPINNL